MIVAGAGGHAKEIHDIIVEYYDRLVYLDTTLKSEGTFMRGFPVIYDLSKVKEIFKETPEFVVAIGSPSVRKEMHTKLLELGGEPINAIASSAIISPEIFDMGVGLNIMHNAMILSNVCIGDGSLINAGTQVHHDVSIGEFSEISPGVKLLGRSKVGNLCSVGSGAIVLPGVDIGDNAIVGAGSVVTQDVPEGAKVMGVPARS
jgi:sugar O-acyltransferase (sialic acid O-acetyltransferase NeuD family)